MGPSAQKSSGVHCCRRRSSSTRLRTRIRRRCGRLWCRAKSRSTGFRRRFQRRFRRRSGRLWCKARSGSTWFQRIFQEAWWKAKSGSTGFGRRFRGGFGAEPGHKVPEKVPKKFLEKVWKLWCVARSGSTGGSEKVPVKVWEALAQS